MRGPGQPSPGCHSPAGCKTLCTTLLCQASGPPRALPRSQLRACAVAAAAAAGAPARAAISGASVGHAGQAQQGHTWWGVCPPCCLGPEPPAAPDRKLCTRCCMFWPLPALPGPPPDPAGTQPQVPAASAAWRQPSAGRAVREELVGDPRTGPQERAFEAQQERGGQRQGPVPGQAVRPEHLRAGGSRQGGLTAASTAAGPDLQARQVEEPQLGGVWHKPHWRCRQAEGAPCRTTCSALRRPTGWANHCPAPAAPPPEGPAAGPLACAGCCWCCCCCSLGSPSCSTSPSTILRADDLESLLQGQRAASDSSCAART